MDAIIEQLRQMVDISQWNLDAVDIGVMIGYFVLMVVVGWLCKSISGDISDYVRMGCKSTWWLMGTSIFMLGTSAGNLTGGAAQAYLSGWSFVIIGVGGFIGYLAMAAFFAPWMRRTRAVTPADAIRLRYGPLIEQVFAYIGAIGGMLWGGVWLFSFAMFMAVIFNVPVPTVIIFAGVVVIFYSVSGGSWSVQITDTLQAYILVPIAIVVFFLAMNEVGWLDGLMDGIRSKNLEEDFQVIMPKGHKYSSTAGNVGAGYFTWGWLIASVIYSFALAANVSSSWRFLSTKSDGDARKAALLAGCLLFFGAALWYMPAMVGRVLYEDEITSLSKEAVAKRVADEEAAQKAADEQAAAGTAEGETGVATSPEREASQEVTRGAGPGQPGVAPSDEPAKEKSKIKEGLPNPADGAYAVVAKNVLPPGLLGLVVIALFAATMSSLDSSLTGNAGVICNNIYPALVGVFGFTPWTGKKQLRLTQVVNFLLGAWAVLLAFLLYAGAGDSSVYEISLNIILLVSLPMVLSMVLSFFVPWLPKWAPLVGMFFGFGGSLVFLLGGWLAGVLADISWTPGGVAVGMQSINNTLSGLMWHHKVYINLGLTVIPTGLTSIFWFSADDKYRARVDNFFKQIRTPVNFEQEVGQAADSSLMKMIGTLGLIMAGAIVLLAIWAQDTAGVIAVFFVVAFVGGISSIMLFYGRRVERRDRAIAASKESGTEYVAPHRGLIILILSILSFVVCFAAGIIAAVMATRDLKQMQAGAMNPAGEKLTRFGRILGILGTLVGLAWFILVATLLYGGKAAVENIVP